jgi:phage repressor protein C with HTH and peptisase S24 domain
VLYKSDGKPQRDQKAGVVAKAKTDLETIAGRLRVARTARGLSGLDIAEACNVSRQAVSQWETGQNEPGINNLEKAATRLNVSLEWLRTGKGPKPDLRIIPVAGRKRVVRRIETGVERPPFPNMIPEQAMGVGAGPLVLDGRIHDWWKLPLGLVTETLRTQPPYLVALRVLSDSMEPGIKLHDYVIVDQADTTPADGKIYVIDNGLGVILRRIFLSGGGELTLRADRDHKLDVTIKRDEVRIVGRCVIAVVLT